MAWIFTVASMPKKDLQAGTLSDAGCKYSSLLWKNGLQHLQGLSVLFIEQVHPCLSVLTEGCLMYMSKPTALCMRSSHTGRPW